MYVSILFTYIYSLLIEKDLFECQNISGFHVLFLCLSSGDIFIVLLRVSSFFYFYFCVIPSLVLSLFMWINIQMYPFYAFIFFNTIIKKNVLKSGY